VVKLAHLFIRNYLYEKVTQQKMLVSKRVSASFSNNKKLT